MHKFIGLKTALKLALVLGVLALIITAIFLTSIRTENGNLLAEAVEGGESTLDAIGRSHESLNSFVINEEEEAEELLKAAQMSQEYANVRLTSSRRTDDDFVFNMVENYWLLLNSSHVMTQGVDNLLVISDDLEETLNYYREGAYEEASEKASVCLQTLTPLVDQFELWNQSLTGINYLYLTSGQKDRVKNAIVQYEDEMGTYFAYIQLLESIAKGVDYLNTMNTINTLFDQLQLLKAPNYQNMASEASELDPNALNGIAFNVAQDLKTQLKDLEGIQGFENYFEGVKKYAEALGYFEQGDTEAAEESIDQALSLLAQGGGQADTHLQKLYSALEEALSSLLMKIRGQPDQG